MGKKPPTEHASVQGEFYMHRYLWLGAERLLNADLGELRDSDFPRLGALSLAYFALEGFLNDLGRRIAPDTWAKEREYFGRGEFRGTLGKLDYLARELEVSFNRGCRPYQTVARLDERRDALVHPRTERFDKTMPISKTTVVEPKAFALAERQFLERVLRDVEELADRLQAAAYDRFGPGIALFERAFVGAIGQQSTWLPHGTDLSPDARAT